MELIDHKDLKEELFESEDVKEEYDNLMLYMKSKSR